VSGSYVCQCGGCAGRPGDALDRTVRLSSGGDAVTSPKLRNAGVGRLVYRPVADRGEPYPDWLRALRGESGVYVIRERGVVVYVGESHTGRIYETLTRHFQTWRRWKRWWDGQYGEGHDPGLTYDRASVEVAVRVTGHGDPAIEEEAALIRELAPRDNLNRQPEPESEPEEIIPF
jgi:hypothetical protein